jgi:hypothetical protein
MVHACGWLLLQVGRVSDKALPIYGNDANAKLNRRFAIPHSRDHSAKFIVLFSVLPIYLAAVSRPELFDILPISF